MQLTRTNPINQSCEKHTKTRQTKDEAFFRPGELLRKDAFLRAGQAESEPCCTDPPLDSSDFRHLIIARLQLTKPTRPSTRNVSCDFVCPSVPTLPPLAPLGPSNWPGAPSLFPVSPNKRSTCLYHWRTSLTCTTLLCYLKETAFLLLVPQKLPNYQH